VRGFSPVHLVVAIVVVLAVAGVVLVIRSTSKSKARAAPLAANPALLQFNSPPHWPAPPAGWRPPPDWRPDPAWPAAPPNWQFWVYDPRTSALSGTVRQTSTPRSVSRLSRSRRVVAPTLAVVVAVSAGLIYWNFFYVPVPSGAIRIPGAHSVAIDPDRHEAYVVTDKAIVVVNLSTREIAGRIPVRLDPAVKPNDLERGGGAIDGAVDPTIRRLIVNHWETAAVTIIDVANHTQVATVRIGRDNVFLVGPPVVETETHHAFIPYSVSGEGSEEENRLAVVDVSTAAVIGDFRTDADVMTGPPRPVALDPDLHLAYISHSRYESDRTFSGVVTVADTRTMTIDHDITVGADCWLPSIAVDRASHNAYASCADSVHVLNPKAQNVMKTFSIAPLQSPRIQLGDGGTTVFGTSEDDSVWSADLSSDPAKPTIVHRGDRIADMAYDKPGRTLYLVGQNGWLLPVS
jgi:DNA-binding beta-propeller fold protein YncE